LNVEEFLKQNKPASGSKLAPFLTDLRRLRSLGYSLKQVKSYLEAQEVYVSVQNISAYLQRHKPINQTSQTLDQDVNITNEGENNAKDDDEDRNLTRRQRGEKEAAKYLTPEAMNPLVKRVLEKQKLKAKKNESSSD
jgi:DNA-binding transcriptional MerR regulator